MSDETKAFDRYADADAVTAALVWAREADDADSVELVQKFAQRVKPDECGRATTDERAETRLAREVACSHVVYSLRRCGLLCGIRLERRGCGSF